MRIVMDDREPETIESMLKGLGVIVERKRIEISDYLIGTDLCVERKTVKDFIRSIYDGRLFDQVEQMREGCERIVIIMEGPNYVPRNALPHYLGAISSLALRGASVISLRSIDETVRFLYYAAKKVEGERPSVIPVRKRRRPKTWEEAYAVLLSFPSIGPKTAEKLLSEFGSLREIFNADFHKLKRVIGEARARKLIEVLEAPFKMTKNGKLV